tara:strand:+ start:81 stop:215 length:135 start_codon:yes stop_codon:yes gene_type:complete
MAISVLLPVEPVDKEERQEQERAKLMGFLQSPFFGLGLCVTVQD